MFVAMTQSTCGAWRYADAAQLEVVRRVVACFGWELEELDAWVGYAPLWRGFPTARQRLITLRHEVTYLCHASQLTERQRQSQLQGVLTEMRARALRCKTLPADLRAKLKSQRIVSVADASGSAALQRPFNQILPPTRPNLLRAQTAPALYPPAWALR
jgi:hypothetical protein